MKWWPGQAARGDMIRVRLGTIDHYGIFVSEEEVIQYGLPPIPENLNKPEAGQVIATDIERFACGQIVEVGSPEKAEKKQRLSPEETVRRARARLGEAEYDLLRNNCEHFAYECVFGVKRSTQEEDARRRWNSRPVLDVYLAPIPAEPDPAPIQCEERRRELEKTTNPALLHQRTLVWQVLEYAADRSFGLKAEKLHFHKNLHGRWSCEGMEFSLSHTEGLVAVAVSNRPVGVDVENLEVFRARYAGKPAQVAAMLRKIAAPAEAGKSGAAALLRLWTAKESLFKMRQSGFFSPRQLQPGAETRQFLPPMEPACLLSVSGEKPESLRFYLYEAGSAHRLEALTDESEDHLCTLFG